MFWLAEDHRVTAQAAASRNPEGGLDFYVRLRGLQSGAHAQLVSRYCSGAVNAGRGVSTARSNATRALRSAKNHPADTQKLPNDANQPRNCWRSTILQQPVRPASNSFVAGRERPFCARAALRRHRQTATIATSFVSTPTGHEN